jgi:hypothetical protein
MQFEGVAGPQKHCHCEEQSDVAIRPPLQNLPKETDCHTILRMVRNDMGIWESLLFQGLR